MPISANKLINSHGGSIKKENLTVPTIVCSSFESDDENSHEVNNNNNNNNNNMQIPHREEEIERKFSEKKVFNTDTPNSSSIDRQDSTETRYDTQEDLTPTLERKQSKIVRYGRKLKSKLDHVKKQFETSGGQRRNMTSFDDNDTLYHQELKSKLAPALTKEYRKKMQEWQTMQKMNFLVSYRRQSTGKFDSKSHSRTQTSEEVSEETDGLIRRTPSRQSLPHLIADNVDVDLNYINIKNDFHDDGVNEILFDKPLLSPIQRTQMVHQWRTIMNEEITLRHYLECIENKTICLKLLERKLKLLKTTIFCTNNESDDDGQSMITANDRYRLKSNSHEQLIEANTCKDDKIQRSRSLETSETVPTLWVLALRSAAYSDILDGTSNTRPLMRNMDFFQQLSKIQEERKLFGENLINDIQVLKEKRPLDTITIPENFQTKPQIPKLSVRSRKRKTLNDESTNNRRKEYRAQLKKRLSYPDKFPNYWEFEDKVQTPTSSVSPNYAEIDHIEPVNHINNDETLMVSSNDEKKRERSEWQKTFQRRKSVCVNYFQSLLRRRKSASEKPEEEQHMTAKYRQTLSPQIPRRKESITTECSSPKLNSLSPKERFNRLHKLIFHQRHRSPPVLAITPSSSTSTESNEMTMNLSPILNNRHVKNSRTTNAQVLDADTKDDYIKLYMSAHESNSFENNVFHNTSENNGEKLSEIYDNVKDIVSTIETENALTPRNVICIPDNSPTFSVQQQQQQQPVNIPVESSYSTLTNSNNMTTDSLLSSCKTPSSAEERRATFLASHFAIKKI
ncbi:unnamed protein product [Didymodactylos carnosus]|uniref:Uncharacterized protein n=1 Tax=Didymodactylos carnosus TaxID=1234261 RepID=A0A815HZ67_9BILA|nr:unnamed protein product [Didymodactylos carnosus]CAF1358247.1 unnamed protein product [Didymodactylos carnosus]CAF3852970.1 unnamed protein product [Didymodactylos carnosus]CAF4234242.1 unnamed protein product [Didymodactylos carnosus]